MAVKRKIILLRRSSQIFFLLLFLSILWWTATSAAGRMALKSIFQFDPLVIFATAVSERIILASLVFSAVMLLLILVLGRFFCGWICPMGTTIDAVALLRRRRKELSDAGNRRWRRVKYILLGLIGLLALAGIQIAWVFDPITIAARFVSLNLVPAATFLFERLFLFLIHDLGIHGPVVDLYRSLKQSPLGSPIYYFQNSIPILVTFILVSGAALFLPRLWCRALCPLGGLYALVARFAFLGRNVYACTSCGICRSRCRMGAIRDDMSYAKGECVLCMDCVYDCPAHAKRFEWLWRAKSGQGRTKIPASPSKGITRADFLIFLAAGIAFLTAKKAKLLKGPATLQGVVRPPGSIKEEEFLNRCVRCGNCMKVCVTNGLQPCLLESGWGGIWTPRLMPEIGYCEHQCTLCGNVCPTGAIPRLPLEEKKKVRLGLAVVDRQKCIAWLNTESCLVCEEHCPVAQKAIKVYVDPSNPGIGKPVVDERLCIGCGICQNKCPVSPVRAIRVSPKNADRR